MKWRKSGGIFGKFWWGPAHQYGHSAIRMLFCKISEHILDEILISGKVQIKVSADYFMFGRNRLSKYIQH